MPCKEEQTLVKTREFFKKQTRDLNGPIHK